MPYLTYNNYINTHVEYIDKIPDSWKLTRNKNLFIKNKHIAGQIWTKYPVLSLTKEGVKIKDIEKNEGKMPSDFGTYQIIEPGNLLLCLFDIDVTPRCVGYIENKGIVSGAYSHIIPITNINMKYYYYWYLMLDNTKELLHLSKNLRNSLSNEHFMELYIVQPSLEEQEQIAKYLDKKTTKIEQTITKNKKLITLLKEKRTSLINQTVTKGLNPDTPMKESEIEWIGKIPKHWKNVPLRAYFIEHKHKNKSLKENNLLSLSYGKIIKKDINTKEGLLPENFENYNVIKKNYIVLRLTDLQNDKKSLRTGLCTEKGIITSAYVTIKSFKKINSTYVHYLLHSYDINKIFYNMGGGVRQNMNFKEFSRLPLLIPNMNEQNEIVDYLDNQTQLIDKTIDKIERNIELLEEYKESLIHHVVTGKIDVRGVEV